MPKKKGKKKPRTQADGNGFEIEEPKRWSKKEHKKDRARVEGKSPRGVVPSTTPTSATPTSATPTYAAADPATEAVSVRTHPHVLLPFDNGSTTWYCDDAGLGCTRAGRARSAENALPRWSCRECGYDLCAPCVDTFKCPPGPPCDNGHPMLWSEYAEGAYRTGWHCDGCGSSADRGTYRWYCRACSADLCSACSPAPPSMFGSAFGGGPPPPLGRATGGPPPSGFGSYAVFATHSGSYNDHADHEKIEVDASDVPPHDPSLGPLLRAGSVVVCVDTVGKWYRSKVVDARDSGEVLITYCGWGSKWDEWVPASHDRIRPWVEGMRIHTKPGKRTGRPFGRHGNPFSAGRSAVYIKADWDRFGLVRLVLDDSGQEKVSKSSYRNKDPVHEVLV